MNTENIFLKLTHGTSNVGAISIFYNDTNDSFTCSFSYHDDFVKNGFALTPFLPLTSQEYLFFNEFPSFLEDTLPERYGMSIMRAVLPQTPPNLLKIKALLLNDDRQRIGSMRLLNSDNEYISQYSENLSLKNLLKKIEIVNNIDALNSYCEDIKQEMLMSSIALGGARPKCNVLKDNELYVAKFTTEHDSKAIEKAEVLVNLLAKECGLNVPDSHIINHQYPIAIFKRFDRNKNERQHYISMKSFVGCDNSKDADVSYAEIAEYIKEYGVNTEKNLKELFSRVMFNILVSNTDDHLKNQGLLFNSKEGGFELSPHFDVNPSPNREKKLKTAIIDNLCDADCDLLIDNSVYFGLNKDDGRKIFGNMSSIIRDCFAACAKKALMTSQDIATYKKAFLPLSANNKACKISKPIPNNRQ